MVTDNWESFAKKFFQIGGVVSVNVIVYRLFKFSSFAYDFDQGKLYTN